MHSFFLRKFTTTGSLSFNQFANLQDVIRNTVNTNLGFHARLLRSNLALALNRTDSFFQLRNCNYTSCPSFDLENFNNRQTQNFRLSV